jgi:hypothetical protein
MDARWVAGYNRRGAVLPYHIFRGWTEPCKQLFPECPRNLRIAADGDELESFPWLPETLKRPGLDGRAAVAIISATEFWGTCITLNRSIEETQDGTLLKACFSDLLLHRSRKYIHLRTLPEMVSAVSLILAVDAERTLRRAIGRNMPPKAIIQICAGGLRDVMRRHFAEKIAETLRRRAIAIEPVGVPSSVTIELT